MKKALAIWSKYSPKLLFIPVTNTQFGPFLIPSDLLSSSTLSSPFRSLSFYWATELWLLQNGQLAPGRPPHWPRTRVCISACVWLRRSAKEN